MQAFQQLLREREVELRNRLQAYIDAHPKEFDLSSPQVRRIWDIEALSRENETYEVRVILELAGATAELFYKNTFSAEALLIFMKLDGDDFEIVGHAVPSNERPEQAAAQSTDPPRALGRVLRQLSRRFARRPPGLQPASPLS